MGDIFGKVQANAQAESTYGIAKLVVEYEGLMSESEKTKHEEQWFPTWLYIVKKDVEDDTIDDVKALRKEVGDLKKENADLNNKVDKLKADIKEILSILKNNT
jgi:wobble nucleotide-excising tRNase